VVRAVLDRCDVVLREARDTCLLDALFRGTDIATDPDDPSLWPAAYALQCALTALWSAVGILPSAVLGDGTGKLAAAWAAGALDLPSPIGSRSNDAGDPAAILDQVDDAHAVEAARLHLDAHGRRAGVERVFDELLDGGGGALEDLAGGNARGNLVGQHSNGHGRSVAPGRQKTGMGG
jgi:acyl transferase domain-containing protein